MKIGINTFHCAHNYGAVLQAYGLQEYLRSLGAEVYIIDYRPKYLTRPYHPLNIRLWLAKSLSKTLKKFFTEFVLYWVRRRRYNAFNKFIIDRLNLYPYTAELDYSEFDAIFLGSDQIWNPRISGGNFDKFFFGEGAKCKVISYAASMGAEELTDYQKTYYTDNLHKLTEIGVREDSLNKLLQPLTKKRIYTTIDPTLLAGRDIFENIAKNPNIKKPYILVYEVASYPETLRMAQHIATQIDAEIVYLMSSFRSAKNLSIKDLDASPDEFVGYIKNAACVVTTSFHGTAFSIIFNRPFYTIRQNNKADTRAHSLLNRIGLLDRFVDLTALPTLTDVNYIDINVLLQNEIRSSREFISNSLSVE